MTITGVTHVGICVSDLDRSRRFYIDGLGFKEIRSYHFQGRSWARILELDEADLDSLLLRRDGLTIELIHYRRPGHTASATRNPMNRVGFTHLAVWVDDIEVESRRLAALGGEILESTRWYFDKPEFTGKWLFCTDPDRVVRIELIEYPDGEEEAFRR
jgi:lactoylglutathione lyase